MTPGISLEGSNLNSDTSVLVVTIYIVEDLTEANMMDDINTLDDN